MNDKKWNPSRLTDYINGVPAWQKWYGLVCYSGLGLMLSLFGAMGGSSCIGWVTISLCGVVWPLSFAFPMFIAVLAEETTYTLIREKALQSVLSPIWATVKEARWLIAGYIILVIIMAISWSFQPDWWDSTNGSGELLPEELSPEQYQANINFWILLSIGLVGLIGIGLLAGILSGLINKSPSIDCLSPLFIFVTVAILNSLLVFAWASGEGDPLVWPKAGYILGGFCLLPIALVSLALILGSQYIIGRAID